MKRKAVWRSLCRKIEKSPQHCSWHHILVDNGMKRVGFGRFDRFKNNCSGKRKRKGMGMNFFPRARKKEPTAHSRGVRTNHQQKKKKKKKNGGASYSDFVGAEKVSKRALVWTYFVLLESFPSNWAGVSGASSTLGNRAWIGEKPEEVIGNALEVSSLSLQAIEGVTEEKTVQKCVRLAIARSLVEMKGMNGEFVLPKCVADAARDIWAEQKQLTRENLLHATVGGVPGWYNGNMIDEEAISAAIEAMNASGMRRHV
jgi:hypothetical protein